MNDPEVTMTNVLARSDLVAHSKALAAAGAAIALAMRVPAPLKSIADQVIRSASSVPANLAVNELLRSRAGQSCPSTFSRAVIS
jgi:7-keto-8-aminopelargonate synthetase-like enzyme